MAHLCFILALRGCIYAFRTSVVEPPVAKVARVATGKGGVRLSDTPPGCSGRDGQGKAKKGAKSGGKTTSSSYEPEPIGDLVVDSLEEGEGEEEQDLSDGFDEEEEQNQEEYGNGDEEEEEEEDMDDDRAVHDERGDDDKDNDDELQWAGETAQGETQMDGAGFADEIASMPLRATKHFKGAKTAQAQKKDCEVCGDCSADPGVERFEEERMPSA